MPTFISNNFHLLYDAVIIIIIINAFQLPCIYRILGVWDNRQPSTYTYPPKKHTQGRYSQQSPHVLSSVFSPWWLPSCSWTSYPETRIVKRRELAEIPQSSAVFSPNLLGALHLNLRAASKRKSWLRTF